VKEEKAEEGEGVRRTEVEAEEWDEFELSVIGWLTGGDEEGVLLEGEPDSSNRGKREGERGRSDELLNLKRRPFNWPSLRRFFLLSLLPSTREVARYVLDLDPCWPPSFKSRSLLRLFSSLLPGSGPTFLGPALPSSLSAGAMTSS
jgi:hypothetical protein